jgi:hypothetical protein
VGHEHARFARDAAVRDDDPRGRVDRSWPIAQDAPGVKPADLEVQPGDVLDFDPFGTE